MKPPTTRLVLLTGALGMALLLAVAITQDAQALSNPLARLSTPAAAYTAVGLTAVKLSPGSHATIHVCSATSCTVPSPAPCYVGGPSVTAATGVPILQGSTLSIDSQELWLVSTAATCNARVFLGSR